MLPGISESDQVGHCCSGMSQADLQNNRCSIIDSMGSGAALWQEIAKAKMSHLIRLWYFVLHKLILQMCMCSHPVGLDVWFLVEPFFYFYTSCVQTAKALARLQGCADLPDHSLVAYVISTIISCAGSNKFTLCQKQLLISEEVTVKLWQCT